MGAREKLNSAYITGALMVASLIGAIGQSWTVFIVAAVVLVALNWQSGDIRTGRRKR